MVCRKEVKIIKEIIDFNQQCATMLHMKLNNAIQVRFDPEMKARLQAVANKSGIKPSALARIALEEFISKIEMSGNLTIPIMVAKPSATYGAGKRKKENP